MPDSLTETAVNTPEETPASYLDQLVGEGKKYRDVEDLARAYKHADRHINELRDDNETLRAEQIDYKELVKELRKDQGNETPTEATPTDPATDAAAPVEAQPGVTTEDVKRVVKDTLTEAETEKIYTTNQSSTVTKLGEAYGSTEKGLAAIRDIVAENPDLKPFIDDLARKDPDSAVMFITGKVKPSANPVPNIPGAGQGENVEQPEHIVDGYISWTEAKRIRREKPAVYHTPEFRERIKAAEDYYASRNVDYYERT